MVCGMCVVCGVCVVCVVVCVLWSPQAARGQGHTSPPHQDRHPQGKVCGSGSAHLQLGEGTTLE